MSIEYAPARSRRIPLVILLGLIVWSAQPLAGVAQTYDPTVNHPVATATASQRQQDVVPDGAGGALVVWQDERNGNRDVYAQRLDADGQPLWTADGVPVCTDLANQGGAFGGTEGRPQVVSDGAGGAIVVWRDERTGVVTANLYAQRLDASGTPLWPSCGVPVAPTSEEQRTHDVLSDGTGGVYVVWEDSRSSSSGIDIYGQRLDGSGAPLWGASGLAISTDGSQQRGPLITSDAAGGLVVAWQDLSTSTPPQYDIRAQRLNDQGAPLWPGGVDVATGGNDQYLGDLVSDASGHIYAAWHENPPGTANQTDVYVRQLSTTGFPPWGSSARAASEALNNQQTPRLAADGAGGVFVTWTDFRTSPELGAYVQYVDASGVAQWTADGVPLGEVSTGEGNPLLLADGAGGALAVWTQYVPNVSGSNDVYTQHLTSSHPFSPTAGIPLSAASGDQYLPAATLNGTGHPIAVWLDMRGGSDIDLYAQGTSAADFADVPSLSLTALLEGPYAAASNSMRSDLAALGRLPISQPYQAPIYDGTPLDYDGTETASSLPIDAVDWVLVELRTDTAASTSIARRPALLLADGSLADSGTGSSLLRLSGLADGSYHVVVWHRNHLPVMTAAALAFSAGTTTSYDFTAAGQTFGTNGAKQVEPGVFACYAGDGNASGRITGTDQTFWLNVNGALGYERADYNMSGRVSGFDQTLWFGNNGRVSQVPD